MPSKKNLNYTTDLCDQMFVFKNMEMKQNSATKLSNFWENIPVLKKHTSDYQLLGKSNTQQWSLWLIYLQTQFIPHFSGKKEPEQFTTMLKNWAFLRHVVDPREKQDAEYDRPSLCSDPAE